MKNKILNENSKNNKLFENTLENYFKKSKKLENNLINKHHLLKCGICYENLENPHKLPCKHNFCFLCISRHLNEKDFCPVCFKKANSYELFTTEQIKNDFFKNKIKILKNALSLKKSFNFYKKILKMNKLPAEGNISFLKWNIKELYLLYKNESFKEKAFPENEIINRIIKMSKSIKTKKDYKLKEKKIIKKIKELKKEALEIIKK